jgi:ABC-type multidrug transport system fused ATPase/permease subunit
MLFVTKKMITYDKSLFFFIFIGAILSIMSEYVYIYMPKVIIEHILGEDKWQQLFYSVIILVGILVISKSISTWSSYQRDHRFLNVRMKLIMAKMHKTNHLPYEDLEHPDVLDMSELAHRALSDSHNGVEGLMNRVYHIFVDISKIALSITILVLLNPIFILAVVFLSTLHFIFFTRNIEMDKKYTWNPMAPKWRKLYYMRHITSDFSYGKDTRLMNMETFIENKQKELHEEVHEYIYKSKRRWAYFGVFTNLINQSMEFIVYGFLVYWFVEGLVTIPEITFYSAATFSFFRSVSSLLYGMAQTKRCSLATDDYRSFMAHKTIEVVANRSIKEINTHTITFEDVSFRYHNQKENVLNHISFTLKSNLKLAIVGMNGAGKTTLIKLILRLYKPSEGRILIDGKPIEEFPIDEYYHLFSPLFQDVETYAFTLAENIAMKPIDKIDTTKVEQFIHEVGLHDKYKTLPKGLNTELLKILDDEGIDLSGGEKQKLALARALYKNAPIVILDEPTASLDALAEHDLYVKFNSIIKNRTAIFISHRLSSTRFCDHILMLDKGSIVEEGTHKELMARKGQYRRIFNVQSTYYKENIEDANHEA